MNTVLELHPFAFTLFEICIYFLSVLDTVFCQNGSPWTYFHLFSWLSLSVCSYFCLF